LTNFKKWSHTGKLPIQPNEKQIAKKIQIIKPYPGLNAVLRIIKPLQKNGNNEIHITAHPIKKIPNNLFVTERRIAYKGKKYHSGTICAGVTKEFAKIKLSECPNYLAIK
jgi:hypothetical protein